MPATASFIGVIKVIFYFLLFYYILKFVMRLVLPLLLKKAVEKAEENLRRQQESRTNYSRHANANQAPPERNPRKQVGEYVDFEEIE